MKHLLKLTFLLSVLLPFTVQSQINELPRTTPAAASIESRAIINMIDTLMSLPETEIHHIMVIRDGKVVAEAHPSPFKAEYVHTLFSCSKTFVSMAVGIAIGENRISLNDRVASYFPDKLPDSISDNLANMTIRNLLTMTSGISADLEISKESNDWLRTYFAKQVKEPGKQFRYDSMCSFTLAAIIQRVTGKTVLDYLKEKLLTPMHITQVDWEQSPDGINCAGWGMRLQPESLAKLGILILNKGKWNGKQLVPEKWIEEATAKQVDWQIGDHPMDINQGYCYQMWRCLLPGAFRADGAYGQFVVMSPQHNLVVVINGISFHTADELKAIWHQLIPGVKNAPLAKDASFKALKKLCATIALPTITGKKTSQLAKPINITFNANRHNFARMSIMPEKDAYKATITLTDGRVFVIPFAYNSWAYRRSEDVPPYFNGAVAYDVKEIKGLDKDYITAGNYAWKSPENLVLRTIYVNWICDRTISLQFNGKTVSATVTENYDAKNPEVISGNVN